MGMRAVDVDAAMVKYEGDEGSQKVFKIEYKEGMLCV